MSFPIPHYSVHCLLRRCNHSSFLVSLLLLVKQLDGGKSLEKGGKVNQGSLWGITISELILLRSLLPVHCDVSCCPAQDPVTMFLFSKSMGPSDQAVSPLELSSKINSFFLSLFTPLFGYSNNKGNQLCNTKNSL